MNMHREYHRQAICKLDNGSVQSTYMLKKTRNYCFFYRESTWVCEVQCNLTEPSSFLDRLQTSEGEISSVSGFHLDARVSMQGI